MTPIFLELISGCCTFVLLIKKDGGTRPNEVLATCANKVLISNPVPIYREREKISSKLSPILG